MERKITQKLIEWKSDSEHLPLIVTGCRQVGKTYSIREFASEEYSSQVYINFEIDPNKKDLFKGNRNAEELISKIILSEKVRLSPGKSAIILDEIQACPEAYSALKPLSEDRRFDVICSGSFLGINLDDSDVLSPLGYATVLPMHPMDFEEYLWAMGVNKDLISAVRSNIRSGEPIDDYFHTVFTEHFRRYMVVGGMPAAVKKYSETQDYVRTYDVLKNIMGMVQKDAGKYSRKADRMKINSCLESIPHQLQRENKKFTYSEVEKKKGIGKKTYSSALGWLREAGLISFCYNLIEPNKPLAGKVIEDSFKVYMNDTGLLMALMDRHDAADIVLRDPFSNNGAVMECAVAAALVKKDYPLYYYQKRNSTLEIDFITPMEGTPVLIEVKSGRNRKSKSLSTLMDEKDRKRTGCKISENNITTDEKGIVHLPLYAPSFFEDSSVPEIPQPPSADDMNRRFIGTAGRDTSRTDRCYRFKLRAYRMGMKIRQAVVMVGGKGTRLRPLTETRPKPALPIVDTPLICYLLRSFASAGITKIFLACGYRSEYLEKAVGDGKNMGLEIEYSVEDHPLGTAGAMKLLEPRLDDVFCAANGDTFADLDIKGMIDDHLRTGAQVTMALTTTERPTEAGIVRLEEDGRISEFKEKPRPEEVFSDLINAGVYVVNRDVLSMVPEDTFFDFNKDLFPLITAKGGRLQGRPLEGLWMDVGRPKDLLNANLLVASERGMFLGKDSVVSGGDLKDTVVLRDQTVEDCVLERCLVMEGCRLKGVKAKGCIFGEDSKVTGTSIEDMVVAPGQRMP